MDQEIASAINTELFNKQAPANIRTLNASRNVKAAITAIMHPIARAEITLLYRDIIITAARTVLKDAIDVKENETWER